MIIAAVSDVHSPIYYEDFVKALDEINVKPDLFLIAGDMVERRMPEEYSKISNALFGKITCPIIAVFGNTEFEEYKDQIKSLAKNIIFLDDQSYYLNIRGISVGIFGSTGALDEPTKWQKAHIPNIERLYQARYERAFKSLEMMKTQIKILLTHYAPTYETLKGENPRVYPNLGSRYWENIFIKLKITLAIHGHAHNGSPKAWVNTTPIFNVAFPVNKKIVIIDTEKDLLPGLKKFV
ncbi:MAG: metallophosphoesterase [Candidatus Aenigmarchaeota archaeon ex4484_224]|nr:MAG: metallophosphoesterase [Candidatus Aenigmarchaeota archaeon ex4484_224]